MNFMKTKAFYYLYLTMTLIGFAALAAKYYMGVAITPVLPGLYLAMAAGWFVLWNLESKAHEKTTLQLGLTNNLLTVIQKEITAGNYTYNGNSSDGINNGTTETRTTGNGTSRTTYTDNTTKPNPNTNN